MTLKRYLIYLLTFTPPLFYKAMFMKERMEHLFHRVHDDDFLFFKNCIDLKAGYQFIDIGGNFGQSALSFSALDTKREIVSFEPNVTLEPYLKKVQALIGNRYRYYLKGVGDAAATLELVVPKVNNVMLTGEASFDLEEVQSDMVRKRVGFPYTVERIRCEIAKFDDLAETYDLKPYIIKMDIQGFELVALNGMRKSVEKFRPIFMIERNSDQQFEDTKPYFQEYNYTVVYFDPARNALLLSDPGISPNYFAIPHEELEKDFGHLLATEPGDKV